MKRYFQIRWRYIILWMIASIVLAFLLCFFDITVLQKKPIIFLSNYSDVVISIWQVQATMASLTLASTAFILGKIENSYYGISIKNLLHLPRNNPKIELSFWEKIICSILVPITTLTFVVLDNITSVTCLFVFTGYLATSILVECINVITRSDLYSKWAKNEVDQLVNTIADSLENDERVMDAKHQLSEVLDEIGVEITSKIRREVEILDDETYSFFIQLMDRTLDGKLTYFNAQMHSILVDWLRLAISIKSEQNVGAILRRTFPKDFRAGWGSHGIGMFMNSYYRGEVSTACFNRELNNVVIHIQQADDGCFAVALYVLRNAIKNADEDTFVKIIKAVWRTRSYIRSQDKSNVLITAIAYLYYMSFKESYVPIEKGSAFEKKLRGFSEATIIDSYGKSETKTIVDILSNTELILDGATFLLDLFNDYSFPFDWEYTSYGEFKSARLEQAAIEFLAFYCIGFSRNSNPNFLREIDLESLLKIWEYLGRDGAVDKKFIKQYESFCEWLGKEELLSQRNSQFYSKLLTAIKEKMRDEAEQIRGNRSIWSEKINKMEAEVCDSLTKSLICVENDSVKNGCLNLRHTEFLPLKDFSEHISVYGYDQVVQANIEQKMFRELILHDMLVQCDIRNEGEAIEENLLAFDGMVAQMKDNGINIDQSYNYDFYDGYIYPRISDPVSKKIREYKDSINNIGQWECGYSNVAIYVDSRLAADMGFCIQPETFMTVGETLTEKELRHICDKYKTEDGYFFKESSNSPEIPFSEEELIEYLRVAMIKIRYCFPAKLPHGKIGFFTVTC